MKDNYLPQTKIKFVHQKCENLLNYRIKLLLPVKLSLLIFFAVNFESEKEQKLLEGQ